MKRIFLSMLALTLTVGAFSQTTEETKQPSKKEWKQKGEADIETKLNLTDAQKTQMKKINDNFKSNLEEFKNDNSLSAEAKKEKRTALMKEHRSEVEAILTPEQKQQWKAERKTGGFKPMKGDKMNKKVTKGDRKQQLDAVTKELNLSSDQTAKLNKLNQDFKSNLHNVKKDTALSAEQKKEQATTLHKQHKQNLTALLTAEQRSQLKEKMKNRKDLKKSELTK